MKSRIYFISLFSGTLMSLLALFAGLILLKTTAWEVAEFKHKVSTGALLIVSFSAIVAIFIHFIRQGRVDGVIAGCLLFGLGVRPLVSSFHYLFLGPSYGGMIGGVGAAITLAQFVISLVATLAGTCVVLLALQMKNES
jgi:hypothetical protein